MAKKPVQKSASKSKVIKKLSVKKPSAKKPITSAKKLVAQKISVEKSSSQKPLPRKTSAKVSVTKRSPAKGTETKQKPIRASVSLKKTKVVARPLKPNLLKKQIQKAPVLTDEDPIALPSEPMPLPIISQPIEAPMGIVTHYYAHLGVAVIHLKLGALRVGNRIHFKGSTTDFRQSIDSIEMDHKPVTEGHAGQLIGLKVIETVREHDHVYKVNHK